ncbi:MAG: hypothetical protein BroJett011_34040 [Chloroflexota bacterium]|nr:MAG: hypothetical protein BroJett011_34040 [Chloroflexota bacterium]
MLGFLSGEPKEQREARKQRQQKINQLKSHLEKRHVEYRQAIEAYQQSMAEKWEYLLVTDKDISQWNNLTNLGSVGWELVGISTYAEGYQSKTVYTLFAFKRRAYDIPPEISDQFKDIREIETKLHNLGNE